MRCVPDKDRICLLESARVNVTVAEALPQNLAIRLGVPTNLKQRTVTSSDAVPYVLSIFYLTSPIDIRTLFLNSPYIAHHVSSIQD